jgi:hypothetical protein
MGMGPLRWACSTVAPWCLAVGLVVSFTATAGIDTTSGYVVADLSRSPVGEPAALIPGTASTLLLATPRLSADLTAGAFQLARLTVGEPEALAFDRGAAPRTDMKAGVAGFPQVDRSRKGDPAIMLRPALSHLLPLLHADRTQIMIHAERDDMPATIFVKAEGDVPGPDSVAAFEPPAQPDTTLTERATALPSPGVPSDGTSTPARARHQTTLTNATPTVPRALSLASNTPAPIDAMPIEIAAAPVSLEGLKALRDKAGVTSIPKHPERPDYASLIDPDRITKEQRCLAEAVYFEARSEPETGQAAVAQVVLNRVRSGLYPTSVCGVVYQNRHRHLACQFTFACEGKALRTTETDAWATAVRIAREVTEGKTYLSEVGGSTHYHANYVRPYWAKRLKKMDVIGRHVFYKLRPGQT